MPPLRVAYFPDSFHEVNGVAHTSRNFAAYAERSGLPFLCVRASAGRQTPEAAANQHGSVRALELRRSFAAVPLEKDLRFDPLFWRFLHPVERELRAFAPDVIHVTGPSELGMLGAWFARKFGVTLAASWHTNLHEYAARRMRWLQRQIGSKRAAHVEREVEQGILDAIVWFYRMADVLYAPNAELCTMLEERTGKRCLLMRRGVNTELFSPARRRRPEGDFVLGYVGRLSVEKNVRLLTRVERELTSMGLSGFRFRIVGQGNEEAMLRRELRTAEFCGVLRGEALAEACAGMDALMFPSHTDTFGNVVLEALASGVPAIVTPDGGPKSIVRDGETGFIVPDESFAAAAAWLMRDAERLRRMRNAARMQALGCSWDAVFARVYEGYASRGADAEASGSARPRG